MRLDELRDVDAFVGEELALAGWIAIVTAKTTARANNTVTRNDETNRILTHSATDCASGHFENPALGSNDIGNVAISYRFAKWNLASDFEDARIEGCKVEMNWRVEVGLMTGKILIKPVDSFGEDGMARCRSARRSVGCGNAFHDSVVDKMEFKQSVVIGAEKNRTERRSINT